MVATFRPRPTRTPITLVIRVVLPEPLLPASPITRIDMTQAISPSSSFGLTRTAPLMIRTGHDFCDPLRPSTNGGKDLRFVRPQVSAAGAADPQGAGRNAGRGYFGRGLHRPPRRYRHSNPAGPNRRRAGSEAQ